MPRIQIKRARIGAALAALILVCVGALLWAQTHTRGDLPVISGIGGPFSLVDHRGKAVSEGDYLGKPTLIFFGFTHCPDVCPTTLFDLTNLLTELGPDADRLNVLFITVDPDRDTPEQLALYLSSFDPRITGLSGTAENIAAAIKAYRVYTRKIPLQGGGYNMDHTATVYMLNSKGQFVGVMNYQEPEATARTKLRRLIDLGGRSAKIPLLPLAHIHIIACQRHDAASSAHNAKCSQPMRTVERKGAPQAVVTSSGAHDEQSGARAGRWIAPHSKLGIADMNQTLRIVFRVPLIGWLLNDAINGAPDAKYYFAANLVLSFILLLYAFGYAFLICFALAATAIGLVLLVVLTSAGMFNIRRGAIRELLLRKQ